MTANTFADLRARMSKDGPTEAPVRALIHGGMADRDTDGRRFALLRCICGQDGARRIGLARFKVMLHDRPVMLLLDDEATLAPIRAMPGGDRDATAKAVTALQAVASVAECLSAEGQRRIERV